MGTLPIFSEASFLGLAGGFGINPLWSILSNIFINPSPAKGLPVKGTLLISSSPYLLSLAIFSLAGYKLWGEVKESS